MQLENNSKFYYGWKITTANRYIDFNDGADKVAKLNTGTYTSTGIANEIKKRLDALSSLDFTVSFNRITRKFTISSTSNFTLKTFSGVNTAQSPWILLGFDTNADHAGASTYTAESVSAYEYATQFPIQSFKDTNTNRKAIDGVINKSASGQIEVIKFGDERFMEGEMIFITNLQQEFGSIIRSNSTGLEDFIQFVEWCTEKSPVEFMVDENISTSFKEFILESTEADSKGLNYDIIELYDRGLANYFRSGKLTFRLI